MIILIYYRWKTEEQPLRIGIWISGQAFGNIFGQGIDYGAVSIRGIYAKSPWKWIYVILGSVTMGFALLMFWKFPDSPMKGAFLTEREKEIAVMRVQTNNTGMQTRKFKKEQFLEAFKDLQLWIICFVAFSFGFANAALSRFVELQIISDKVLNLGSQLRWATGYFIWLLQRGGSEVVHASIRNGRHFHSIIWVSQVIEVSFPWLTVQQRTRLQTSSLSNHHRLGFYTPYHRRQHHTLEEHSREQSCTSRGTLHCMS